MGIAAAEAAVAVVDDEDLERRATEIGGTFDRIVKSWRHPHIQRASSRGSDLRIWINEEHATGLVTARRISALCLQKQLPLYPKANVIRMSAPMVITDEELKLALAVIKESLDTVVACGQIPGENWLDIKKK